MLFFFFFIGEWGLNSKCQPETFPSSQIPTPDFRNWGGFVCPQPSSNIKTIVFLCWWTNYCFVIYSQGCNRLVFSSSESNTFFVGVFFFFSQSDEKAFLSSCYLQIGSTIGHLFLSTSSARFPQSLPLLQYFGLALYQPTWTALQTPRVYPADKAPIFCLLMRSR